LQSQEARSKNTLQALNMMQLRCIYEQLGPRSVVPGHRSMRIRRAAPPPRSFCPPQICPGRRSHRLRYFSRCLTCHNVVASVSCQSEELQPLNINSSKSATTTSGGLNRCRTWNLVWHSQAHAWQASQRIQWCCLHGHRLMPVSASAIPLATE
jgi:hypothetical protein